MNGNFNGDVSKYIKKISMVMTEKQQLQLCYHKQNDSNLNNALIG